MKKKDFLNCALKEIMSITKAECGSLFLYDPDTKELVLASFYNSKNLNIKGLRKGIGEGISGKVANLKRPVLVKDIDLDPRFESNGFSRYKTKSFISIPMFDNSEKLLGLINLTDKSTKTHFCESDLKFAAAISKYASLALDKLNNHAALEKYASVGKLAVGLAHEFNNPLDGIIRYTNLLLEHVDDGSVAREYLLEVRKGLSKMTNITRSLLEFSRQVNSNSHTEKYVNLHRLIDDSLDVFFHRLDGGVKVYKKYNKSISLILDLGLQHVFINIIKNALDAMEDVGVLTISTALSDSMLKVSFKDTGIGIPSDIKEQIFEPFFTTKTLDKGTGLGLTICREIINKYKGRIEVKNSRSAGIAFVILIPQKFLKYE